MYYLYLYLLSIGNDITDKIHHISHISHQIYVSNHKHRSNKCAFNMRVWGNGEEGMREYGDRWGFELYGP